MIHGFFRLDEKDNKYFLYAVTVAFYKVAFCKLQRNLKRPAKN